MQIKELKIPMNEILWYIYSIVQNTWQSGEIARNDWWSVSELASSSDLFPGAWLAFYIYCFPFGSTVVRQELAYFPPDKLPTKIIFTIMFNQYQLYCAEACSYFPIYCTAWWDCNNFHNVWLSQTTNTVLSPVIHTPILRFQYSVVWSSFRPLRCMCDLADFFVNIQSILFNSVMETVEIS